MAANRARSLHLSLYSIRPLSAGPAAIPHFYAGRCACWLLPGIRHTHARAHAHGLALIHLASTTGRASLGIGGPGGQGEWGRARVPAQAQTI